MKRPSVVLGLAALTGLLIFGSFLLIVFSVNPGVNRNDKEIKRAVASQHAIICAQVQNTANAYRFRSLTPSGEVEPIQHFLIRMQAQQQTLRLARGSNCMSTPGFPPVGIQVRRALAQIKRILEHFDKDGLHRDVARTTAPPIASAGPTVVLQEETPYFPKASLGPSEALGGSRGTRTPKEAPAPRTAPPSTPEGVSSARPVGTAALGVEASLPPLPVCVRVGELVETC